MSGFKVGDRVRIAVGATADSEHRIGDVGHIVEHDRGDLCPWVVDIDGARGWYADDELERIETPSPMSLAVQPYGMTSQQLADYVQQFITAAQSRVTGVGHDQYGRSGPDGKPRQLFEDMTPGQILRMAREEAQDLAVYAAMLDIRLARIGEALNAKGVN